METLRSLEKSETVTFDWKNSASVQHLLDVISSILAEEYIVTAKENPEVFIKKEQKHESFDLRKIFL